MFATMNLGRKGIYRDGRAWMNGGSTRVGMRRHGDHANCLFNGHLHHEMWVIWLVVGREQVVT